MKTTDPGYEHRLKTLIGIFKELSEDDQYILIADAHTLREAARLEQNYEEAKKALFTLIKNDEADNNKADIIEMQRTEERE